MIDSMRFTHVLLLCICALGFVVVVSISCAHDLPLSWDVWYHLRISRQFSQGEFFYDAGSFGPEGRPHGYPPVFHVVTAGIYLLTPIDFVTIARVMPPVIFVGVIYTLYLLTNEIFNEKIAVITCVFAAVSPLLLDRAVSYTPEALSFIFINMGLLFFWQKKWGFAGICGGLLILTHGLSSAAFFAVIFIFTLFTYIILKENLSKQFMLVLILSAIISVPWVIRSVPMFVPKGFAYPLEWYPEKLGWIHLLLAFLGVTALKKDKKSVFILSFVFPLLFLSQYAYSLPYRFTEFLVFPVCMLAGLSVSNFNFKGVNPKLFMVAIPVIFLLAFAQSYWVLQKYHPVVTHEEINAFTWLDDTAVSSEIVISEWKTAPVIAFFSKRAPVKGAYQFGAPDIAQRTQDTVQFYTNYDTAIVSKYCISFVYYGTEELQYTQPPFSRVYATSHTSWYHE
jgi:hypothetical protein